ncbi:FliM/FliN family flagellar motor C-terminal domain-containing protein [Sphingomonas koreensis]
MTGARTWLPPDTSFGEVDRKIAGVVRDWSQAWFCNDHAHVAPSGCWGEMRLRIAKPHSWAAGAWLLVPDGAVRAIARAALQIDPEVRVTQADEAVFDSVGEDCLAGLRDAFAAELGLGPCSNDAEASAVPALLTMPLWPIECASGAVRLGFVLLEESRVELLHRLLPPPPPRRCLSSLSRALAPLEVELAANLGTCSISLSELRALSTGDVLVLERDLTAASPLAINGVSASAGSCTVSRKADTLLLEISEPIIGTAK